VILPAIQYQPTGVWLDSVSVAKYTAYPDVDGKVQIGIDHSETPTAGSSRFDAAAKPSSGLPDCTSIRQVAEHRFRIIESINLDQKSIPHDQVDGNVWIYNTRSECVKRDTGIAGKGAKTPSQSIWQARGATKAFINVVGSANEEAVRVAIMDEVYIRCGSNDRVRCEQTLQACCSAHFD
jgi:hypothetical protein